MTKRDFELVYVNINTGYPKAPNRGFSNPRHFVSVRIDVTRVIVVGDWPRVVKAYTEAGVPVMQVASVEDLKSVTDFQPTDGAIIHPPQTTENDPSEVEIPEDWMEFSWPAKRGLAKDIDGESYPKNKAEAELIIQNELDRRKLPQS